MVIKCIYCGCKSSPDILFHNLPLNDEKLLTTWLCKMKMQNFQPNKDSVLCSAHFDSTCYQNSDNMRPRLKKNAVPTIFENETLSGPIKQNTAKRKSKPESVVSTDEESDDELNNLDYLSSDDDSEYNKPLTRLSDRKNIGSRRKIKSRYTTPRFVGDFREIDLKNPQKMRRMWDLANNKIDEQKTKIKSLQQKNKTMLGQITRLKNIIRHLKTVHR